VSLGNVDAENGEDDEALSTILSVTLILGAILIKLFFALIRLVLLHIILTDVQINCGKSAESNILAGGLLLQV
jgi:hypothetical protein